MTKTFTPTSPVDLPAEKVADEADQQGKLFYNSIKPQLNELIKDPSDEVINKILAHSKSSR